MKDLNKISKEAQMQGFKKYNDNITWTSFFFYHPNRLQSVSWLLGDDLGFDRALHLPQMYILHIEF